MFKVSTSLVHACLQSLTKIWTGLATGFWNSWGRSLQIVSSQPLWFEAANQARTTSLTEVPLASKAHMMLQIAITLLVGLAFFTARCTTVQSAVLRSHVVCLSVCLWRWWIMTK